jgi:ABC-2 type transport system ATP-binding protein
MIRPIGNVPIGVVPSPSRRFLRIPLRPTRAAYGPPAATQQPPDRRHVRSSACVVVVLAASTVISCDPAGCGLRLLATFDGHTAAMAIDAREANTTAAQEYVLPHSEVGGARSLAADARRRMPGYRLYVSTNTVVSARGVVKRYGRNVALAGLDADIGPGITGLLGSNGAGKTTFILLVLGLRSRTSGELSVLGQDPATTGIEVRSRIGYAPEHHDLPAELAATDFVRHLAELHLLPRRAAVQRANDALWLVGLGEERFRPVGTMSTGQRQRVKLAAAIAHDPELILLDEPTDGLDPVQRTEMLALIRRIGTEFGVHILISSHHLEEVERICDSVVIVEGGEVVHAGTLEDLRRGPEGLVVEVDERADELSSILAKRGFDVTVDGGVLLLGEADNAYDEVRDAVAELGVGLRRLAPRGRTLEDVYLGART